MSTEKKPGGQIRLTMELVNHFLADLLERGRSPSSLKNYHRILTGLYDYLPEDKLLDANTGPEWKAWQEEQGFSTRTVNARISVLNSLYQYIGRRAWTHNDFSYNYNIVQPELTRAEYLRLLSTAKMLAKERSYLLIKVMGGAGLRIQELPQLTVEAVRQGIVNLEYHNHTQKRVLHIPWPLKEELLDYIRREKIESGPVFTTHTGAPLDRSTVYRCVNSISKDAQVAVEKANPRCLWKMYQSTHAGIRANIDTLTEQAYVRMLNEEELTVGWDV